MNVKIEDMDDPLLSGPPTAMGSALAARSAAQARPDTTTSNIPSTEVVIDARFEEKDRRMKAPAKVDVSIERVRRSHLHSPGGNSSKRDMEPE
ncbi:hypothetical protein GSI_12384 [Ganoderma sinense ZZ0214-1]|uniref:Uncharacterized protein n=1 Tax=Ganoderma sinense ZZ0214-1 TaxID=1077348 RepID=A0A2G8RVJ6_9APHY|nr:hypothetical protein GSI_12384 [Ganoderma sinense ZZ0214-1]